MKGRSFAIGLVISLFSFPVVFANQSSPTEEGTDSSPLCETVEDCESLIGNLDQQLSEFDREIANKTNEQQTLKKERESKTKTVEDLRASVLKLKEEIRLIEEEIQVNEAKQQALEKEIQTVRERINKQMIFSQRDKHKNMMLTLISEAESFVDLIKNLRSFEHFSRQGMEDIAQLKQLIEALNRVIEALETDRKLLVDKQTQLEEEEALLVEEINHLIEIEKQLQIEIQNLQSYVMEAEEIKRIVEEQRSLIIKESDEYFGVPTEHGYVTCEFKCYIDKNGYPHSGIDIGNNGDTRTKILASLPGVVSTSGWHPAYGNYVMITHNIGGQIYTTLYAHMHQKPLVKVGDEVVKGQHIGFMGTTGNSTGVHLHFEIYKGYYQFPHAENPRDYVEFPLYW